MTRKRGDCPRVFCVGWHKTGTSTLGLALIELGYSVLGCRLDMVHPLRRGKLNAVLDIAGQFDALQDVPWAALFRQLDERYPGSRFILTERTDTSWLRSASRHFGDTEIPLHQWLYGEGRLTGNEELYLRRFRQHNGEVREYFENRPEDLLVMNISEGDGWKILCDFLGYEIPTRSFPHTNKSPHSYNTVDKLHASLRSIVPDSVRRGIFYMRQSARYMIGKPDPRDRFHNMRENRAEQRKFQKKAKG